MQIDKYMVANGIVDKAFIRILARDPKPIRLEDAKKLVSMVNDEVLTQLKCQSKRPFGDEPICLRESTLLALTLWISFLCDNSLDTLNEALVTHGKPHLGVLPTLSIGPEDLRYAIQRTLCAL